MQSLRDRFQNEADQLFPGLNLHLVLWGDDPGDTVVALTGKLLGLGATEKLLLRRRLADDAGFRSRTAIYQHLADYNAGPGKCAVITVSLGDLPAELICLNLREDSALGLKQAGLIHPGYPDFILDIPALNYHTFAHEIAHPALYALLGVGRGDAKTMAGAIRQRYAIAIQDKDARLFEERVVDLFACGLTACRLGRAPAKIGAMIARLRMAGLVKDYADAIAAGMTGWQSEPPSHYTTPVLDRLAPQIPAGLDAMALMRHCLAACVRDYDPAENAENLFATAHACGLLAPYMDGRFRAAKALFRRGFNEVSLTPARHFAARYVRAEKELLDLCRKKETDPAARKKLAGIRTVLAESLYPERRRFPGLRRIIRKLCAAQPG